MLSQDIPTQDVAFVLMRAFAAAGWEVQGAARRPAAGQLKVDLDRRDCIAAALRGNDLVVNTLVTDWNEHEATAISDVIFLLLGDTGWAIQIVGRYQDTLHNDDGTWRFHRRAAEFVTEP